MLKIKKLLGISLLIALFSIGTAYAQSPTQNFWLLTNGGLVSTIPNLELGSSVRPFTTIFVDDITVDGEVFTKADLGGTPEGSSTQVQYNNAGSFGGISGMTTDGTTVKATDLKVRASTDGTILNFLSIETNFATDTYAYLFGGGLAANVPVGTGWSTGAFFTAGDVASGSVGKIKLNFGSSAAADFRNIAPLDSNNSFRFADGSVANPTYSFLNGDMGMYREDANTLGFATNGSLKLSVNASGLQLPNSSAIQFRNAADDDNIDVVTVVDVGTDLINIGGNFITIPSLDTTGVSGNNAQTFAIDRNINTTDLLGRLNWTALSDDNNQVTFAQLEAESTEVEDGNESGSLTLRAMVDGALESFLVAEGQGLYAQAGKGLFTPAGDAGLNGFRFSGVNKSGMLFSNSNRLQLWSNNQLQLQLDGGVLDGTNITDFNLGNLDERGGYSMETDIFRIGDSFNNHNGTYLEISDADGDQGVNMYHNGVQGFSFKPDGTRLGQTYGGSFNAATQSAVAGVAVNSTFRNQRIQGASSSVTITATPSIVDGVFTGQEFTVFGNDSTNHVTLQDELNLSGSNLYLSAGANVTLNEFDNVTFTWNGDKWIETGRMIRS